jgi:4,5-dihydroxyphthalate decarboxylase
MTGKIKLTFACDDFEVAMPLLTGAVEIEGVEPVFVTELSNPERHGLMVKKLAFDVCELNVTNYLVARDQGVPITAIPVFLFRKFRHGNVYVNTAAGIKTPADLAGRRVGASNMQVASNVWIAGILEEHYGLRLRDIIWVLEREEDTPFDYPIDLKVEHVPAGKTATSMLLNGEIDALMHPNTPKQIMSHDSRIARLFPDYMERELAYFNQTGLFPIMHVTAVRQDVMDRYPWLAAVLFKAFEKAKAQAYHRMHNVRVIPLAWFEGHWEEERHLFGPDAWPYGLDSTNRRNLETIIHYSQQQGLIRRPWKIDELFTVV